MREIDIPFNADADNQNIIQAIERAIAANGLTITLRASLKKFPGCIHWHIKNDRLAGTLEITFWPQQRCAWFAIQEGRKADWIEKKIPPLAKEIQRLMALI